MIIFETKGNEDYDGTKDRNIESFLTVDYLKTKYSEYNLRFFHGELNPITIKIMPFSKMNNAYGQMNWLLRDNRTGLEVLKTEILSQYEIGDVSLIPNYISIANVKWGSRFQMENCLVHEMCHLYSVQSLLNFDLRNYIDDSSFDESGGNGGHGIAFQMTANSCVNNNNDAKKEGFEVCPKATGDELLENFFVNYSIDCSILESMITKSY